MKTKSKGVNTKVIIYSFLALICLVLTFFVDWIFILGAFVLVILSQRELMKKRK